MIEMHGIRNLTNHTCVEVSVFEIYISKTEYINNMNHGAAVIYKKYIKYIYVHLPVSYAKA